MTNINPFNPSFGTQPMVKLARQEKLNTLVQDIKSVNTPYRTTLIYGTRGVGKTVFMNSVGQEIEKDSDWITIHLIIGDHMVEQLIELLYQKTTSKLKKLFKKLVGINLTIKGVNVSYRQQVIPGNNYQYILRKMLTILNQHHRHVLVLIDEAQPVHGLIELASVYPVLMGENLPISIIMTGLPKNVQELQNHKVLTFLLRSGRVNLSPLNYYDIRAKYQTEFVKRDSNIDPETLREMAQLADGYAYAFQLLGYLLWRSPDEHITTATIERILPEYQAQLSRNAYSKMLEELSPMDQQFVIAIANSNEYPVSTAYLGKALHKKPGYIGMYRRRLIESQVVESAGFGKLKFALPLFREFIQQDGQYLI